MPDHIDLEIPGGLISCPVRVSERARSLRIRVLQNGSVEVVMPPFGVPEEAARRFLEDQRVWILRNIRKFQTRNARRENDEKSLLILPDQLDLPYLGGMFRVEYEWTPACWTAAQCLPEQHLIRVTGNVLKTDAVHDSILDMLKQTTATFIFPHLLGLAERFGFQPGPLSVRTQKGRWGSCSSRGGAISLNALLLRLPENLVEYVLIHELCHLRHMNHSDAFWREVEKYCPDWHERRRKIHQRERYTAQLFLS